MNNPVLKPWGSYTDFIREQNVVLKELVVAPGSKLSLQTHKLREEHWICISGNGKAVVGDSQFSLETGSRIYVPKNTIHRIINDGKDKLRIAEVQIGICDEDDIVRHEDDFGRT
ncbi:MAG: phosphomannose isomerase type II C-terminal cupin domain [Nanoarchaeota archaeon]